MDRGAVEELIFRSSLGRSDCWEQRFVYGTSGFTCEGIADGGGYVRICHIRIVGDGCIGFRRSP